MRQKNMFIPTLREAPAEAEAMSHQLLLRAGYIRQMAAGIYSYLPLGWRVLHKIESIVREEMDNAGFQEMLMPGMQPAELWEQSGRYDEYGPELIRLRDRHEREFVLGPTHEEVITSLVAAEVSSYRKLPLRMYQIQTKFRDERRPRFGLLRGREFTMKDAYSFDRSWEGLDQTYQIMLDVYRRIFTRCGLDFKVVEAEAGSIGGEGETHEFMALADIGEDVIVSCPDCGYAANLEKASAAFHSNRAEKDSTSTIEMEKTHTPGTRTVEELTAALGVPAVSILKTLIYTADGQPVAVVLRGDHELNENKLMNELNASTLELADPELVQKVTGTPHGYVGPCGLQIPVYLDQGASLVIDGIAGANEADYHVKHVVPYRDFQPVKTGDYRNAQAGDLCPCCSQPLLFSRGIEIGHVFKLGTKYSEALGARYTNEEGKEQTMIMGCYGIGVSRLLSAVSEQSQGDQGMCWPLELAPYQVHIIPVSMQDTDQASISDHLAEQLQNHGIEVLLDDRDERAGVKFKDADLLGIPLRIVVGKGASEGIVEWTDRFKGEQKQVSLQDAVRMAYEICSARRLTL